MVTHGIVPTNVRLHTIHLMDTDKYIQRERKDSLLQCFTDWGEKQEIWDGTHLWIALLQTIDPRHTSKE